MLARHVSDPTVPFSGAFLQAVCADCKNAPEDGPVSYETCRANICDEYTQSLKKFVYLVGLHIYTSLYL